MNKSTDEVISKGSAKDIAYHASPVSGIKKFRKSEDTSGANKGKVIFVSRKPSFCSAFGIKWNDGNARLVVETTNNKPPTNDNYNRTVLKVSDEINLDAPCSMYKLRGNFKPLRCNDDIEEYTDQDVEIVSEEQFKSFKDMAKFYGLELKKIKKDTVLSQMKYKKTSNFEKGASEIIDELYKEALEQRFDFSNHPTPEYGEDSSIFVLNEKPRIKRPIKVTALTNVYRFKDKEIADKAIDEIRKSDYIFADLTGKPISYKIREASPLFFGKKKYKHRVENPMQHILVGLDSQGDQMNSDAKYFTQPIKYQPKNHTDDREIVKYYNEKTASEVIDFLYKEANIK